MQRRRSTPQNPSSSNRFATDSSGRGALPGSQLSSSAATTTTPTSAGIELRDRPSHGTSSSISRPFATPSYSVSISAAHRGYAPPATQPYPPTPLIMKPIVGAMQAWSCVVISVFAIIILSVLGLLFRGNHHEVVGGVDDPENGPEVAATIFVAVLVYAGFLVFCGLQGILHLRENRRGAIALQ